MTSSIDRRPDGSSGLCSASRKRDTWMSLGFTGCGWHGAYACGLHVRDAVLARGWLAAHCRLLASMARCARDGAGGGIASLRVAVH
jgi:hypothetical protein